MNWRLPSKARQKCSLALGLLFILLWLWLLRSSKVHAKRKYLFQKLLRLIRSSAVMHAHKTDESEWNKSKKGFGVVSWKSSLVDHQNLAAFRMLCIFRGGNQKWPTFQKNVLGLLGDDIGLHICSPNFNADRLGHFIKTPLDKIGHIGYQLVLKFKYLCYQYFWSGMTKFCCEPLRNSSFSCHSKFLLGCWISLLLWKL